MIAFENDEIQVVFVDHGSDYLLLAFSDAQVKPDGEQFFARGVADRLKVSALGFVSFVPNWFPEDDMIQAMEALKPILDRYKTKLSYGYSMGAYAVIKFAPLLKANATIAMCPQFTINPSEMQPAHQFFPERYRGHKHATMNITATSNYPNIFLFYDNMYGRDVAHMRRIVAAVDVIPVRLPYIYHDAPRCFAASDRIGTLFKLALHNDVHELLNHARACRKWSTVRKWGVAFYATLAGHLGFAKKIVDTYGDRFLDRQLSDVISELAPRLARCGQFVAAQAMCVRLLTREPDSATAQLLMLEMCLLAGDNGEAGNYADNLRRVCRENPVVREKIVRLMLGAGQIERARCELADAIKDCPAGPGLLDCQAELALRDKNAALAVEFAREAARLEPNQVGRRERLGMLLAHSGQSDEAIAVLTEVLAIAPRRHAAQQALVDVFFRQGELGHAVRSQREHVDIEPTNPRTRERLIRLLLQAGDVACAQTEVDAACALFPRDPGIWSVGSEVAEKSNQLDRALELALTAARLAPHDPNRKQRLGDVLIRTGRYEEAIAAHTAARAVQPQHKGALWGLVDANIRRGTFIEAIAVQRERIALEPDNPALLDFLGFLLLRAGEVAAAEAEVNAAIALFPGNAQLLQRRSEVAEKAGDLDQALNYAERAAEIRPSDCGFQERVGFILVKVGRFSEAERQFRHVLQLEPQRVHIRRPLADAMLAGGKIAEAIAAQRDLVAEHPADVQLRVWQIVSLVRAGQVEAAEMALDAATTAVGDDASFEPWRRDIARRRKNDYTWVAERGDEAPESFWSTMHQRLVPEIEALRPRVLFLGDSITQAWATTGRAVWTRFFAPLRAGNAGIVGERTQGLLWRLDNGALPSVPPELVVLLIGTNNIPHTNAEYVARGILAVIAKLVEKLPNTKLLLLGLLPRGAEADDRFRLQVREVNRLLRLEAKAPHLRLLDLGGAVLEPDGTLSPAISPDGLHFSPQGYERLGPPLAASVHAMLGYT